MGMHFAIKCRLSRCPRRASPGRLGGSLPRSPPGPIFDPNFSKYGLHVNLHGLLQSSHPLTFVRIGGRLFSYGIEFGQRCRMVSWGLVRLP